MSRSRLLGVGAGDEVIVPTLTFVASANPVRVREGDARPRRRRGGDLEPRSSARRGGARASGASRASGSPTAIEVVHLLGHPADLEPRHRRRRRVTACAVIEDASEALGATLSRRAASPAARSATVGRVGCFSFNGNKLITTGGGGMLVTDDETLAAARPPPLDPGAAARAGLRPRRGRLQLPPVERQRRPGPRPAGADRRAARGPARESPRLTTRRSGASLASCRPPGRRGPTRRSGSTRPPWLGRRRAGPRRRARVARPRRHRRPADLATAPPDAPVARAERIGGACADDIFERAFCLPSTSSLGDADRGRVAEALAAALA